MKFLVEYFYFVRIIRFLERWVESWVWGGEGMRSEKVRVYFWIRGTG